MQEIRNSSISGQMRIKLETGEGVAEESTKLRIPLCGRKWRDTWVLTAAKFAMEYYTQQRISDSSAFVIFEKKECQRNSFQGMPIFLECLRSFPRFMRNK